MANASIGAYSFPRMEGEPPLAGVISQRKPRAGVDGSAYVDVGYTSPVAELTTWTYCASAAAVATAKINGKALQGSVVTIMDHHGTYWYNIFIEEVQHVKAQKHGGG